MGVASLELQLRKSLAPVFLHAKMIVCGTEFFSSISCGFVAFSFFFDIFTALMSSSRLWTPGCVVFNKFIWKMMKQRLFSASRDLLSLVVLIEDLASFFFIPKQHAEKPRQREKG